jgi:hypothetical protein
MISPDFAVGFNTLERVCGIAPGAAIAPRFAPVGRKTPGPPGRGDADSRGAGFSENGGKRTEVKVHAERGFVPAVAAWAFAGVRGRPQHGISPARGRGWGFRERRYPVAGRFRLLCPRPGPALRFMVALTCPPACGIRLLSGPGGRTGSHSRQLPADEAEQV